MCLKGLFSFGLVLLVCFQFYVVAEESGEAGGEEVSLEDASKIEDSANELNQKLEQLKALLDAKGENADPDLKAKLAGLQSQLSALGLGDLAGGFGDGGSSSLPDSKELQEFLTACVMLSMKRAGDSRQSTLAALRLLARDKLTTTEAADMELWRMTATCINELTEEELKQFKNGQLRKLPMSYVELSKKSEATKQVTDLEPNVWNQLKIISLAITGSPEDQPQQPIYVGMLAAIPMLGAVGFLGKKFMDMQAEKNKPKEKKREGKKSK